MRPIEIFLEKPRVFILTLLFILISGTSALNSLPRQENPELAQRWASVQVVFPGASPERIETQVLEPLEAKLREVYEVRRLVSSASDGFSITLVELKEDVDPLLIEDTWSEVQDKIDQAKAVLPNDINTELIRSSGPPATLLYAIKWIGDGPPPKILMTRVANDLRLELAYGGGTDKALLFGGSEEEVLIEIDNAKLSSMGLSFQEISTRLRTMDNKRPIGVFTDQEREILIKSKDNLRTIQEIEDLPIQIFSGTEIIRLSDIANIKKTPRIPSEEIVYVDGQPAILIQVNAAFQQRIDVYVKTLEEIARKYDANLPSELSIIKLYDESCKKSIIEFPTQWMDVQYLNFLAFNEKKFKEETFKIIDNAFNNKLVLSMNWHGIPYTWYTNFYREVMDYCIQKGFYISSYNNYLENLNTN